MKDYKLIGKLLLKTNPALAEELLSKYTDGCTPRENDLEKIPFFYTRFLEIKQTTNPTIDERREFIAAMLHLYQPILFKQPFIGKVRNRLLFTIANTFGRDLGNASRTIRQITAWEKCDYDNFRTTVRNLINQLYGENI